MKKTIIMLVLFLTTLCLSVQAQNQNIIKPPFTPLEDTMETIEVFVISPISISGNTKNQSVNIHFLGIIKKTSEIHEFIAGVGNSFNYDFTVNKTEQDIYDELENIINLAENSSKSPESTIFIETLINFDKNSSRIVYEVYDKSLSVNEKK